MPITRVAVEGCPSVLGGSIPAIAERLLQGELGRIRAGTEVRYLERRDLSGFHGGPLVTPASRCEA